MDSFKLDSYHISLPIPGICKSHSVMGQCGNTILPLAYLRKPKRISQEAFEQVVSAITLTLPKGFEIEPTGDNNDSP